MVRTRRSPLTRALNESRAHQMKGPARIPIPLVPSTSRPTATTTRPVPPTRRSARCSSRSTPSRPATCSASARACTTGARSSTSRARPTRRSRCATRRARTRPSTETASGWGSPSPRRTSSGVRCSTRRSDGGSSRGATSPAPAMAGAHDLVLRQNRIRDNAGQGIVGSGARGLIDGNVVADNGSDDEDWCVPECWTSSTASTAWAPTTRS